MELVGRARSYFGGFLCVCWAPDGRYVVVGGEDDLVTVWAVAERRVVARGEGHRSWVSVVAFDPYAGGPLADDAADDRDGDRRRAAPPYRLGSVSQDTQLCLWDLTEDVLRPAAAPQRARASHLPSPAPPGAAAAAPAPPAANGAAGGRAARARPPRAGKLAELGEPPAQAEPCAARITARPRAGAAHEGGGSLAQRLAGFSFGERRSEHRRNFSLGGRGASAAAGAAPRGRSAASDAGDPLRLIGSPACPRFDECPVLEPLVCKKIAHERLTALLFRAEYFVTACADGCVNTWARPARAPPPAAGAPPRGPPARRDPPAAAD